MAVPLTLKVFKGDQLIAAKDYDRDIIKIGRLSSAHLCLDDEKVSRIHSVIEVAADGTLSIIDMGSVEGTWVNGKRVNKGALSFGDEIKVGATTIKVESAAAQATENIAAAVSQTDATEKNAILPPVDGVTDPGATVVAAQQMQQTVVVAPPPTAPAAASVQAAAMPPPAHSAIEPSFASTQRNDAAPRADHEPTMAIPIPAKRAGAKKGAGPAGLAIRIRWGADQILAEHMIHPGKPATFTVGSAAGVNFEMGEKLLPSPSFVAAKTDGSAFSVRFTGKMKGELHRRGEIIDLKQAIESGKASHEGEAYAIALSGDDFVWVDLGGVTLEATIQSLPKPVIVPFSETIDFTVLNIFLVTFFLAALFVIGALNRDAEGDEYDDDLNGNQARIAKLIIKPPDVQKNPLLEKLKKEKENQGEMAAKHRGDEGQMGKKDAPKRSAHAAPKGDPNNKDQARLLAQKIFGSNQGGISTIFGHNGLGGELKSAMGNMFGAAPGDAGGFGGLGLRGSGSGGGGTGDTIGIGGIGTKGRGGGTGSYGTGVGVLGGKKSVDIGITSSEPTVMGSLDKELIRQVIKRNINQIRYCYESQLTRNPKLSGKVSVKFVISASGTVAQSQVAQSTAGNAELETCVAGRVRTWVFPKPKGGGVVIVTYPFVFTQGQ
ncbi:MAG: adventurous gliding motility protein GltG [Myxococcaceae bacterium]